MVQKPMEERGENDRKHVVKKCWTKHIESPRRGCIGKYNETWGKHDNDQRKMLGTNHAKSVGTWRKPERMLGANHDDTVNMLEKYSESAGKCDNNERKWCKKDRKMKETGKTHGLILILKRHENAGNQRKWCKNLWRKEVKMIGNM